MANFAEIGLNNTVIRVLIVSNDVLLDENGNEVEALGKEFCRNLLGGTWVQTSYNGSFRKNFAAKGFTYDSERDAFIPQKPFDSWLLDEDTCRWVAPVPIPEYNAETQSVYWDEQSQQWIVEEQ